MAGHSKFKNIMHRKGAQDKKRSSLFSKLSREITVAAKMGLPDPDANARLRAAINAAEANPGPDFIVATRSGNYAQSALVIDTNQPLTILGVYYQNNGELIVGQP